MLLAGGVIDVWPDDLLNYKELRDPFDMLSFLNLDGGSSCRLGVHTDTEQLMPCLCSCDSMYPPGMYDVLGGEFL